MDIIDRLVSRFGDPENRDADVYEDAAVEIARLRAEVARLNRELERLPGDIAAAVLT